MDATTLWFTETNKGESKERNHKNLRCGDWWWLGWEIFISNGLGKTRDLLHCYTKDFTAFADFTTKNTFFFFSLAFLHVEIPFT